MTTLEIILIAIIWIVYGFYSIWMTREFRMDIETGNVEDSLGPIIAMIIFAPIVFTLRAINGAFKEYK